MQGRRALRFGQAGAVRRTQVQLKSKLIYTQGPGDHPTDARREVKRKGACDGLPRVSLHLRGERRPESAQSRL